jgi:hypothetical protein
LSLFSPMNARTGFYDTGILNSKLDDLLKLPSHATSRR